MQDPYKVLGISRDADETAIKKAYRAMSKKYHPDNNPGNKAAEEVFKQVQEAYEQIMREKKNGYSSSDYSQEGAYQGFGGFSGFGGFNGFGGQYTYQDNSNQSKFDQDLKSAYIYINNGYYDQALNVLNSMEERNDKWYYYSAIANMRLNNNVTALEHAKQALAMSPGNYQYSMLVQSIEQGNSYYAGRSKNFSINSSGTGSFCIKLILCNVALNLCMGGGGLCCGSGMGGGGIPLYPGM